VPAVPGLNGLSETDAVGPESGGAESPRGMVSNGDSSRSWAERSAAGSVASGEFGTAGSETTALDNCRGEGIGNVCKTEGGRVVFGATRCIAE
jgi:hypothetical protein